MSVEDNFKKALETFRKRSQTYGNSYTVYGQVMIKLFPKGLTLKTETDFVRFGILTQIVSKLSRYTNSFPESSHADSIHDLGVYALMLETVDEEENNARPSYP